MIFFLFLGKNNHTDTHSISYAPPMVIGGASEKLSGNNDDIFC